MSTSVWLVKYFKEEKATYAIDLHNFDIYILIVACLNKTMSVILIYDCPKAQLLNEEFFEQVTIVSD